MGDLFSGLEHEFRRHKGLSDDSMSSLNEQVFFERPAPHMNSVAVIAKHLAGSIRSRWTDMLTTDGEKPGRNRDGEFELTQSDTREAILDEWEQAWAILFATLAGLGEGDLGTTITIRGEPHTVLQALLRGLTHSVYHTGQILYVARLLVPDAPWLTIAPGQSGAHRPGCLKKRE